MVDDKVWGRRFAAYKTDSNSRSWLELALTIVPIIALWVVMWWSLSVSYWLTLLLAMPTSAFLVRLFIIQHDCGHGAFFTSKSGNDWLGRALGVFTWTPYDDWRREHALHHAGSGNLERRGFGDITTLTVEEFQDFSKWKQFWYQIFRNPITLFIIGPAYQFLLRHRWHTGKTKNLMPIWSTHSTNLGILAFSVLMIWLIGWKGYFIIQVPLVAMAGTIGVWLFYVQHQFEDTYWEHDEDWKRETAALHGSSYYDLPKPFMWLTGYIGIHHVHHVSSKIPFHALPKVLKDYPELKNIGRITFWESVKCLPLTLWDEKNKKLISFGQFRRYRNAAALG